MVIHRINAQNPCRMVAGQRRKAGIGLDALRGIRNMVNFVRTRPQRRLTQAELDAFLEKPADMLRGVFDHSESRGYVFALLFYKRINDVGDPDLARDPRIHDSVRRPHEMLNQFQQRKPIEELKYAKKEGA